MSEQTGQDIEVSNGTDNAPQKYSRFHAFAQHGEHAQRAFNSLGDLPESFQHEFLKTLDENPSTNIEELASRIRAKAEGRALPEPAEGDTKSVAAVDPAEGKTSEAKPKDKLLLLSPARKETDDTVERLSALEKKVRDLGAKIDDVQKAAFAAAGDVQQRVGAVETKLDRLVQERSDAVGWSSSAPSDQSKTLPSRREMLVNLVVALIFVASIAVAAAYVNKWPAGIW